MVIIAKNLEAQITESIIAIVQNRRARNKNIKVAARLE